jgi:ribosomal protein S27E
MTEAWNDDRLILVTCPSCGKRMKAEPRNAGQRFACPRCGAVLAIPFPNEAEQPAEFIDPANLPASMPPATVRIELTAGAWKQYLPPPGILLVLGWIVSLVGTVYLLMLASVVQAQEGPPTNPTARALAWRIMLALLVGIVSVAWGIVAAFVLHKPKQSHRSDSVR